MFTIALAGNRCAGRREGNGAGPGGRGRGRGHPARPGRTGSVRCVCGRVL